MEEVDIDMSARHFLPLLLKWPWVLNPLVLTGTVTLSEYLRAMMSESAHACHKN